MKAFPIVFMLGALFFKKSNAKWITNKRMNLMKHDERIGDYIDLNEHETLRLGCIQLNDNAMFIVPATSNNHFTEYNNNSSSEYVRMVLIVDEVTELNTGTYTCQSSKNRSTNDTVYVFVHRSKVFVPPDYITIPFIEEGSFIPCRTTQLVNNKNVKLYANKKFIKTDWNDYDPRYGFRIRDTMQDYNESNADIFFECRFKNETYQETNYFFVREWIHPTNYTFMNNSEVNVNDNVSKSDVLLHIGQPWFTAFNDYFFLYDSQVEINCTTSFTDHAEDFLVYRTKSRSNYNKLKATKCELLSVIRSGGKKQRCLYHLKLVEDIQVECKNNEKNSSETASLYLADRFLTTYDTIENVNGEKESHRPIFIQDNVNVVCVIPAGPSDWTAYWRKSNETEKNLTTTTKIVGNSKHVIHSIRNITTDHRGTYECVVEKDQMSRVMKNRIVILSTGYLRADDFHCRAECHYNYSVHFNERIELECHFHGLPEPKFQWYKDKLPYTHGVKNGSRLIIANAREEDDGIFKCEARTPDPREIGNTWIRLRVYGISEDTFLSHKAILVVLVSVMLIFFAYIFVQYRTIKQKNVDLLELYKKLNRKPESLPKELMNLPVEERIGFLSYNHNYEVDLEKLEILEHLGAGQFGRVNRGLLQTADPHSLIEYKIRLQVAVKSAKTASNLKQLEMMAHELIVMCAIPRHPNVVALVGAVTKHITKGLLYVITEYIDGGDLLKYLRKFRSNFKNELCNTDIVLQVPEKESYEKEELLVDEFNSLSTSDLLSIGLQIANGMEWLANVPCVHRDLACRNVLITNTKIIRIADFGLTKKFTNKSYYRLKTETLLPIPMMSPEAIDDSKFTEKSDVWSFGLCLYEIFTLGETPYPNCCTIQEIIEYIENGNRNAQPKYCPKEIYKLMEMCWKTSPKKRPTFKECVKFFKDYMQEEAVQKIEGKLQLEREEQQELDSWIGKSLRAEGVEDRGTGVLDKL